MLSDIGVDFWVVLCGPGVGLDDPCASLPAWDVLTLCHSQYENALQAVCNKLFHNLLSAHFIIFFFLSGEHGGVYHPVILRLAQFLGLWG